MAKLMFAKTHEWILVDGENGKIGISDHAQKELGDLVFIELPAVGDALKCGKTFMNVESVKAVSELYSPLCGTVTAVNEQLEVAPERVNEAAMDTWIAEVKIDKLSDELMTEDEYNAFIK